MKKYLISGLFVMCLLSVMAKASLQTQISYDVDYVSDNRWIYSYEVSNISLAEGISEFTIWFDYAKYAKLTIETQTISEPGWTEWVWQSKPFLLDNGGYDGLSLTDTITQGESVSGFRVAFDWLGQGRPAAQAYEILNPDTFVVTDSGFTTPVPEPVTMILLGVGSMAVFSRRRGVK